MVLDFVTRMYRIGLPVSVRDIFLATRIQDKVLKGLLEDSHLLQQLELKGAYSLAGYKPAQVSEFIERAGTLFTVPSVLLSSKVARSMAEWHVKIHDALVNLVRASGVVSSTAEAIAMAEFASSGFTSMELYRDQLVYPRLVEYMVEELQALLLNHPEWLLMHSPGTSP
nr:hypothetical protein [Candidatus Sigynarchaeota archaeon]